MEEKTVKVEEKKKEKVADLNRTDAITKEED
jgi:hypothetical protein